MIKRVNFPRLAPLILLIFLFLPLVIGTTYGNDPIWATEGGDHQRTIGSPFSCSDNPGRVIWTYRSIDASNYQPAIDHDGTMYIGDRDAQLHAVNSGGTLKWKVDIGFNTYITPTIDTLGRILVGTHDGHLICLNREGERLWTFEANGSFDSSPVVASDGTIYACVEEETDYNDGGKVEWGEHRLYSISSNGNEKWSYFDDLHPWSGASVGHDGTIYLNTYNIIALHPNGTMKWSYDTESTPIEPPVVSKNDDIIFSNSGSVVCLTSDGDPKWKAEGYSGSRVAISEKGNIFVFSSDTYSIINRNGDQILRDIDAGSLLDIPDPVIDSDENIIWDSSFSLKMIDRNGSLIWTHVPEGYYMDGLYYGFVNEKPVVTKDGIILYYCRPVKSLVALGPAPPAEVKDLKGTSDEGQVTLKWSFEHFGAESPSMYQNIDGFRIYRRNNIEDSYTLINETGPKTRTYVDDRAPYKSVNYKVVAFDGDMEGNTQITKVDNNINDLILRRSLVILGIIFGSVIAIVSGAFIIFTILRVRKDRQDKLSRSFYIGE